MSLHEQGYFVRQLDGPREYPNQIEQAIGARIKDNFRAKMPIMVFAYMGEQEVYIPTRELVRQDAFQSQMIIVS